MRFHSVCLASIGYLSPGVEITSDWIEEQLFEQYQRLKLPVGRLEGMSGISQRRIWSDGVRLSDCSVASCRLALESSGLDPSDIGCLIHASVCREFLEPATACRVHHLLGIPPKSWVYDVSNACLGVLNGAVQIAQLIESGSIRAGLVVGTEDSRGLLKATLNQLKNDAQLTRQSIKPAFASLTIGSGSCAWLLVNSEWYRKRFPGRGADVSAAVAIARTEHHGLCQSDTDQAGASMLPTMNTDSEMLLEAGLSTGKEAFLELLSELDWTRSKIQRSVCHQVGAAHRRRILETLELSPENDYATFARWGNTGSVALPIALAQAIESGFWHPEAQGALLGIGSGVNSLMLGLQGGPIAVKHQEESTSTVCSQG
ncbi:MAG: 3-oxoacyl-ACP synthase III [Pirellula sp.]|jgi:3-oxoacyl-[acyl-carrier-protein] synthase-3